MMARSTNYTGNVAHVSDTMSTFTIYPGIEEMHDETRVSWTSTGIRM
jgi:hypothetical protein